MGYKMKTESNSAAYPVIGMGYEATGLTKLEVFTMAAMQGIVSNEEARLKILRDAKQEGIGINEAIGNIAVCVAKATIEALNKEADND